MIFFYTTYELVLAEKKVTTTLKKESAPRNFTLQIITPAREFLGMPFGGGLVKMSRLYDQHGRLIHASNYSQELKSEIKHFKKDYPIPYFKLWKGFVFVCAAVLIGAAVYGIKHKIDHQQRQHDVAHMMDKLQNIQAGQRYGATFFTDQYGNSIQGVPAGWIKIDQIVGDTLYIQRSKKLDESVIVFAMDKIASFKPKSAAAWEEKIEKMDYKLLLEQLKKPHVKNVDLLYIGADRAKYTGVILTIKGSE